MKLDQRSLSSAASVAALLLAASAAGVVAGCNRNHVDRDGFAERSFDYSTGATDPSGAGDANGVAGTTTITGADLQLGAVSSGLAVERIVAARCARETACNNVGAGKRFVDHDICAREVHAKLAADLDAKQCTRGIDSASLDGCMDAIRTESCNNPVDTLTRLAACRTSDMCLKVEPSKKR